MNIGPSDHKRIVFMGTPEFALPSLSILLEHNHSVVGVITVPDKPAGRGQQVSSSPVKKLALQHNLPVLQPEQLDTNDFIEELSALAPDIIVVVAFRILPRQVFTLAKLGSFNLHASLLPKYRGAAPINWAIIKGEKETGVTTFFLEDKVDTGNMILQARVPIMEDETAGELHDKLSAVGAEIVLHTVRLIELGKAARMAQDHSLASPAPKIFKEQCAVDWNRNATEVHNFIRGLSPKPCAYTMYKETMIKLYRSRIVPQATTRRPGEILHANEKLIIAAGDGAVEILEVQQEGKKVLPSMAFLRGFHLAEGEKFVHG